MKEEHVETRLHDAIHRGSKKATEEEVAAVVLAIVTEVTAELALVIADLAGRVERTIGDTGRVDVCLTAHGSRELPEDQGSAVRG